MDIIGNNILPALGIEARQKKLAGSVNEKGTDRTVTFVGDYPQVQCKYIKNILKKLFEQKGAFKKFLEPLFPNQVKGK